MKKLLFLLILPLTMQAQPLVEKTPPDYIKTIIFKANGNDKNQFPIVRRNESTISGVMRRLITIKSPIAMPIGQSLLC